MSLCGRHTVSLWQTHSVSVWKTHRPDVRGRAGGGGGARIFWSHTQPTIHSLTHNPVAGRAAGGGRAVREQLQPH